MIRILVGDVREKLNTVADGSVHCCVTSPPYWGLRDYGLPPVEWPDGWRGCLGLEPTPALYVTHLVDVMREVRRVLRYAWVGSLAGRTGRRDGARHRGYPNRETVIEVCCLQRSGMVRSRNEQLSAMRKTKPVVG